jgi:hypothetical protein
VEGNDSKSEDISDEASFEQIEDKQDIESGLLA